ncbi:MAG TPA: hypothetical protein VHK06_00820 [Candidatus Limnocylindria bacterium]|nr:hypothetical protein [Candidatus Limnocylindria bacterium]
MPLARSRLVPLLIAAGLLLALAVGSVLAGPLAAPSDRAQLASSHEPQPSVAGEREGGEENEVDEPELAEGEALTDDAVARLVERLAAAGITASPDDLRQLAAAHGAGGAVRILAWEGAGADRAEVIRLRGEGLGWGRIARDLNAANPDLGLHPGIGRIMSAGRGQGRQGP